MNNIATNRQPKKITNILLGLIPILILVLVISCEEDPSELGANLLPNDTKLGYKYDTMIVTGTVHENKPMHTTNLSYYNIGIYNDSYFGNFKGEFACQFYPTSFMNEVEDIITIDSVILYLDIDSIYGLTNDQDIYFNIYELNNDIEMDSVYYSNIDIDSYYIKENEINTDCILSGDSLLKFPLKSSFANKFISFGNDIYDSDTNFREIFKGISIIPELINEPGGIINFNLTSNTDSKIIFYYQTTEDDSLSTTFSLSYRFAKYINDYSAGLINDYIENDPNENDSLLFVQGLNSVKSKLKFEDLKDWKDSDSVYSVLNAELTIPVAEYDHNGFAPPEQIFFYFSDTDSTLIELEDYTTGILGGTYDTDQREYKFNIPKHMMNILNENIEDSIINFTILNKSYYPNRVILKSGDNINLNITYTKH